MIPAALLIAEREYRGEAVLAIRLLAHHDATASGQLPDLKIADGVVRDRAAAVAAFVVAAVFFQSAEGDSVAGRAPFREVIDPDTHLAAAFERRWVPAWRLANGELDRDLRAPDARDSNAAAIMRKRVISMGLQFDRL